MSDFLMRGFFQAMSNEHTSDDLDTHNHLDPEEELHQLTKRFGRWVVPPSTPFKIGDFAAWKKGLEPIGLFQSEKDISKFVAVTRILDPPLPNPLSMKNLGNPQYGPFDIVVLMRSSGQIYIEKCLDSRVLVKVAEEYVHESFVEHARMFLDRAGLLPGEIVCWKPYLKNKSRPKARQLGVVMEILPHPIFDTCPDSLCFHEPLDIKIGIINSSDELVSFLFDSRRFCRKDSKLDIPI